MMSERHSLDSMRTVLGTPRDAIRPDQRVRIWSGEWRAWWRPNGAGYTTDVTQAGVYDFSDAWRRSAHCGPEKMISYEVVSDDETLEVVALQRYLHRRTGGSYQVIAVARMQAKDWSVSGSPDILQSADMEQVVVYRSLADGEVWVRPIADFRERFDLSP